MQNAVETKNNIETYGYSLEAHLFAERMINNNIWLCNELQELYANQNECWFENLVNDQNPCEFCEQCEAGEHQQCEDPQQIDIFQWYLVDEWLAKKLIAIGEPVLETDSQYLWGRTCCGQAIILDGTFQRIYQHIDKG